MSYKIVWSNFAESELDKIFEYYIENASRKVAEKILQNILAEPNRLIENSEMFQYALQIKNKKQIDIDKFKTFLDSIQNPLFQQYDFDGNGTKYTINECRYFYLPNTVRCSNTRNFFSGLAIE
jgi:hypothetical protein